MIRYDLRCNNGDEFEAWFGSIADYDKQTEAGLVECPHCGSKHVTKAPMAPAVQTARSKEAKKEHAVAMAMAAKVREHIKDNFDYVGDKFADEARKMHSGESEERAIWGEATPEEARELAEEGIPASPLPPELAPVQPKKLN
ncbi:MAG: DUF1178 family protein [Caulobacteraceae bacterium]